MYCDNKSVIHQLQALQMRKYNPEWMDADVFQSIVEYLPPGGTFQHIKGHQKIDDTASLHARMNTKVDKLANLAIEKTPQEFQFPKSIILNSQSGKLYSVTNIIQHCQKLISERMWINKLGNHVYNSIDWDIFNTLAITFRNQNAVMKLFNHLTPTRERHFKINQHHSSICPICNIKVEDFTHVLFCSKNPERLQLKICTILQRLKKYGSISTFCTTTIQNIENSTTTGNVDQQSTIGWNEIIRGKVNIIL